MLKIKISNYNRFFGFFLCAQVTWRNLERPIARRIVTVDPHVKTRVRGAL